MPDAIFADPRLAAIYDALDGDRGDLDAYRAIARELDARTVLDIGCGTGCLVLLLVADGRDAIGLDPAAASLDVARAKPGADGVRWILGDARSLAASPPLPVLPVLPALSALPVLPVDLVTMTGNVAQAIAEPGDWAATLRAAHDALRPGGHLVFETRVPRRRAWEAWTRDRSERVVDVPGVGFVRTWVELLDVSEPLVSFRWTWVFGDGRALTSDSTLRFRELDELSADLAQVGFELREVREAPDRPGLEHVLIARREAR